MHEGIEGHAAYNGDAGREQRVPAPLEGTTALIVGGDAPLRSTVRFLLEDDGWRVIELAEGTSGVTPLELASSRPTASLAAPGLVVAIAADAPERALRDLTSLRGLWRMAPSLLLSRNPSPALRSHAFACGVAAVAGLPLPPAELQRRLRATARGASPSDGDAALAGTAKAGTRVAAGGLILRPAAHLVGDGRGWSAALSPRETALLAVLMAAPGQTVPLHELLTAIWGSERAVTPNALAALVRRLRARLAARPAATPLIHTDRERGYRFEARARPRTEDVAFRRDGPRVLVVDDDEATARMVCEVLRRAGYTVVWGDGAEAAMLARRERPDVVLLDINMPGTDGPAVRRQLRATPATAAIPVIAFSAGRNLRAHVGDMAPDDYLSKPFRLDDLLLRVARWAGPGAPLPPVAPGAPAVSGALTPEAERN